MDFLLRKDSPFTGDEWNKIDQMVVNTARQTLTGRKFIHIFGPLGAGTQSIPVDEFGEVAPGDTSFFGDDDNTPLKVQGRRFTEIPMIYKDLVISWRDLENSKQYGLPLDLSSVAGAAAICAKREDLLIFWGNEVLGFAGLVNATKVKHLEKKNWLEGENPFQDVAVGIKTLQDQGFSGKLALAVSPDLYMQMQRIQPKTNLLEIDRVKELVGGNLYQTPVLGENKAVLVCPEPQNMDLVIGQDMITAYLGPEKLNHELRVLETALLRLKRKDAVIVFE
ncbi:MAG TPA: bacteriocin [Firmicutes bacterium]|nr:bacteriocin [Bacillota bacterium]